MARLIVESNETDYLTRIGGHPHQVTKFVWPKCRSCRGPMQFIAQIAMKETGTARFAGSPLIALVFLCQNSPGLCDEWDADDGANEVVMVESGNATIVVPDGPTTLPGLSLVTLCDYDSDPNGETDDDGYIAACDRDAKVLGKLGGHPLWIQADETPECSCGRPMTFVAQLEERGGGGDINFGGAGVGYVFVCGVCEFLGKFLFQC